LQKLWYRSVAHSLFESTYVWITHIFCIYNRVKINSRYFISLTNKSINFRLFHACIHGAKCQIYKQHQRYTSYINDMSQHACYQLEQRFAQEFHMMHVGRTMLTADRWSSTGNPWRTADACMHALNCWCIHVLLKNNVWNSVLRASNCCRLCRKTRIWFVVVLLLN
jgi:hypothetical protein